MGIAMTDTFLDTSEFRELALAVAAVAQRAGAVIMPYYGSELHIEEKVDQSPVTAADKAAEAVILEALAILRPDIPVVAEELASEGKLPDIGPVFFLVDPLDGTREFIGKREEFTVNIALIVDGSPYLGVVYAPALGALYVTLGEAQAFETNVASSDALDDLSHLTFNEIHTRKPDLQALTVVASRSHMDEKTEQFLSNYNVAEKKPAGSSIKFCRVASGDADLYPRFGRTMEWDTAAGHAVLKAAGGTVTGTDGEAFIYGKVDEGYANPGFICWGTQSQEQ